MLMRRIVCLSGLAVLWLSLPALRAAGVEVPPGGAQAAGEAPARAGYAQEVSRDQPAAWWRFQDPLTRDKDPAREEMGAHPAVYRGSVTIERGVPGIGGDAAKFDGKTAYIEIPDHKDFALNTLSIEFWFRTTQPWTAGGWPASATLVSKATAGSASSDWAILGGAGEGRRGCIIVGPGPKPGADHMFISPGGLNDGAWHHLVWTRTGEGENRVYIDGALVVSHKDSGGTITNDRPIQVGADTWHGGGKCLDGLIAELAIYKTALDEARVVAHLKAAGVEPRKFPAGAAPPKPPAGPEVRDLPGAAAKPPAALP